MLMQSSFAKRTDSVNLKWHIDRLDISKIKTVSTDSIKLINVVDNDVAKNTVYNELIIKVMKSRMLVEQTK